MPSPKNIPGESAAPALVGIVPRKNLWQVICDKRWYHLPADTAPANIRLVEYLAFYFPAAFGPHLRYSVRYYAPVRGIEIVPRIRLFPTETGHPRAEKAYYRIDLGEITELPRVIPSRRWRRIVHIPSSYRKLVTAREINDLYATSPIEEKMYAEMKRRSISAERQLYVRAGGAFYCLDFGLFCRAGMVDVECDGERYHVLPGALTRDRRRNNELTSRGWEVLRFSGREIHSEMPACFQLISRTITRLGGLRPAEQAGHELSLETGD